jgi:Zn finger protein HypA/HybF involved in hydrogenase expression
MCKNKVQFQTGYSLIDLFKNYGAENQCIEALFTWRWPAGFRCPHCGSGRHNVVKTRNLYQCTVATIKPR